MLDLQHRDSMLAPMTLARLRDQHVCLAPGTCKHYIRGEVSEDAGTESEVAVPGVFVLTRSEAMNLGRQVMAERYGQII